MADPLGVVGDLSAAVSALAPSPQQALIGRLSSPQLSFRQFAAQIADELSEHFRGDRCGWPRHGVLVLSPEINDL